MYNDQSKMSVFLVLSPFDLWKDRRVVVCDI